MASLNKRLPKQLQEYTHEGAVAKKISPYLQLRRSVMSCMLWEDEFYEDGEQIADRIATLATQVPLEQLVEIALEAKHEMRLRHAPLFLAREVARHEFGSKYIRALLGSICTRPDDLQEFLAMYNKKERQHITHQSRLGLNDALKKFDEYQLAKYNGGQALFKLKDVIKLCHPEPKTREESELYKKVLTGTLATPDTWEVEISKSTDKGASWTRLLQEGKLGGLALLRNLRNMNEAGVDRNAIKEAIINLKQGRLLPINFVAAARTNPAFEAELEDKFLNAFTKEKVKGRTAILVDVSSSMSAKISQKSQQSRYDVATSLAMIAREMFEDVVIYSFSGKALLIPNRRGFALRDAILKSQGCSGTDVQRSIQQVESMDSFDRMIVITDEQSHSKPSDPRGYKGYFINVASSRNGVGYGAWKHIDGWSDKVLDYIVNYENSYEG